MSTRGGLPAIDPYIIARHWWLNQLRHHRARYKYGTYTPAAFKLAKRGDQKELCKLRKERK